jgi:hypothetical protein
MEVAEDEVFCPGMGVPLVAMAGDTLSLGQVPFCGCRFTCFTDVCYKYDGRLFCLLLKFTCSVLYQYLRSG